METLNQYDQNDFTATYSPEDDKLRLYADTRIEDEDWALMKNKLGFQWAPKQKLFFASWSPAREDFCQRLAGEIVMEQTTLAERAAAKADRLDALAQKRSAESNTFYSAAQEIARRFEGGQPILVGHHSERRARKDQERIDNNQRKSAAAANAADYWNYRAVGVERHANRKHRADVRERRIKKLLAELRSHQRAVNHGHYLADLWTEIERTEDAEKQAQSVKYWSGSVLKEGGTCPFGTYGRYCNGELSAAEVIEIGKTYANNHANNPKRFRFIHHLLNRLAYERSELGPVERFEGELTGVILQGFARQHGADKPKAKRVAEGWQLVSPVPLPLHIGDGCDLTLSSDEWRDLMQRSGYTVTVKPPQKNTLPPILNFKAEAIKGMHHRKLKAFKQISVSKEDWANMGKDFKGTRVSECGSFRFRFAFVSSSDGRFAGDYFAVFLADQKAHPVPDSLSVHVDTVAEV